MTHSTTHCVEQSKIATTKRYIYLNLYAYLLLFMGIGIVFTPLHLLYKPLLIAQIIAALLLIKAAVSIFKRWPEKRRSYSILIRQNKEGFRADTFSKYMQAPCGRLLVRVVLKDLGAEERYKELKKEYTKSFCDTLKSTDFSLKPKKTEIHFGNNTQPSQESE